MYGSEGYGLVLVADHVKTGWKRASTLQKLVQLGVVGLFGALAYHVVTAPTGPRPAWCTMPPEPVERDPNAPPRAAPGARLAPTGRGHYR